MIDGISEDRVFDVKLDVVAEINAVIIQGGKALNGGGIRNNGTLTLNDVTVTANTAGDSSTSNGGGVLNVGTLTAVASRISGNDTTGSGAGIDNVGSATLTGTAVIGNIAAINGGGLNNISGGALTIEGGSRIETNTANSPATGGGGILAGNGTVTITDSTLRGNTAVTSGGAINVTSNAIVSLTDSTVSANSTSGGDCSGTVTTAGVNLDSDGTCAFALSSAAPGLDTLQDNGGPTFTHALLVGSPAINAALASACAARDQRGVLRPAAFCDIGAFERSLIDLIGDITWVPATDFDLDWFLNLSASNNGDDGASNVTGTVTLPPEVRFSSAPAECVLTSDETTGAETVTCDCGDLAAGASAAVDIRVTTVQSGAAVAGATVTGIGEESNPANDSASATTQVSTGEAAADGRSVDLVVGFNLASWTGQAMPIEEAVAGLGTAVEALFFFDSASDAYLAWRRAGPAFLNDVTELAFGDAFFILMARAAAWVQP